MKANLRKQDRNGVRTATDLQRRYSFTETEKKVEETSQEVSSISIELSNKVDKIPGKGLSTNDFTNTYKQNVEDNTTARHTHANKTALDNISQTDIDNWNNSSGNSHTHTNKTILDGISSTDITNWNNANSKAHTHANKTVLDGITSTDISNWDNASASVSYNLETYKVSGLTILRSSCIVKNNRVVINFVGTINMAANTTTTIFNLPDELKPTATKDFVVFGQTNNNDGYVGYGYITNTGLMQVRFSPAITSYMRFSLVYDLE